MKVAGIIAEYNPFHRGHQYHIAETRRAGATHVVAVMSGSFVQRGDFALFSKWTRAQAAVRGGVDLVLELPAVYSLSCAERFARAGVALLDRLGGVDLLSFGSESGTLSPLYAALNMIEAAELGIQKALRTGQSYPQAMANAVAALQPSQLSLEGAVALLTPNNILGVEYLRALQTLDSEIKPFTVRRCGAEHDQAPPSPAMTGEAPFLDVTSPLCAEEGGAGAVSKSAVSYTHLDVYKRQFHLSTPLCQTNIFPLILPHPRCSRHSCASCGRPQFL